MLQSGRVVRRREGCIPGGRLPAHEAFTVGLFGCLARTPAALVGVALADAVGDRRTQNIPGTTDEYPNWRMPLCNGDGEAVLLEDLPEVGLVEAVVNAAKGARLVPARLLLGSPPVALTASQRPDYV